MRPLTWFVAQQHGSEEMSRRKRPDLFVSLSKGEDV